MLKFQLLGHFQVVTETGEICRVGSPKVTQTLAVLLSRANEFVSSEMLITELWGDSPPRSALNTIQTYIHHARRFLAAADTGAPAAVPPVLSTRSAGYLLRVADEDVDYKLFELHVSRGASALRNAQYEAACDHLRQAMSLWRGSVLSNIATGPLLKSHITHLEDCRVQALEMRIEARCALGLHRDSIPELRTLVHDYPLHEGFHSQLINALHHTGRRAEALEAYQAVRGLLRDELGLEPSALVQRAHERVLSSDGGADWAEACAPRVPDTGGKWPTSTKNRT
ncbi:BTAD domain-containing putative transcriptional regulator [Streptomyces sp. NPDC048337]|uniref:AfsR/SARP family transcriptional regulator n=1 Tax=Streptomyces sp. NPDC048337 TaxID=3365535 RepID=UPI00371805F2